MGIVLKLVKASPVEDRSRPFRTVYYDCAKPTSVTMFKRIGRARTQAGALKAATIKLANGTFRAADIYNDVGTRLYRLRFDGKKLAISGAFHDVRYV